MYLHTAEVSGSGTFPLDMLRYDGCFPADGAAVSALSAESGERWTVRLLQYTETKQPRWTEGRWSSFLVGIKHLETRRIK